MPVVHPIRRRRHRPRPDVWTFEIKVGGRRALAYERGDRGDVVFVRWTDLTKTGRERRRKRSLDLVVRDERGTLDSVLIAKAEEAVVAFFNSIATPADIAPEPAEPMTLAEGIALAFASNGPAPTLSLKKTPDVATIRGYANILETILGPQKRWIDIVPGDVAVISHQCAKYHEKTKRGGARTTERIIATLFRISSWLRQYGKIPATACVPVPQWRGAHIETWSGTLEQARPTVKRPRHAEEEYAAILARWGDADPRLCLAMEVGVELRLGQVLNARRSQLAIGFPRDVFRTDKPTPFGAIDIQGAGKKLGEIVQLTARQRAAVNHALSGYLSAYETAFVRGEIRDYPLFPAGEFVDGVLVIDEAPKPWHRRAALRAFHALERLAGVEPVAGRGWYGLRRLVTDLAPKYTNDSRVLDRLSANTEDTRTRVYQDRRDAQFAAGAADVRDKLRSDLLKLAARTSDGSASGEPSKSLTGAPGTPAEIGAAVEHVDV